ncbi:hypothetical protein B0J15DRAFT_197927 [Fusarium solani]|uniref:Uncharacterized protein n=1 Tax=Fusarium solani TaxID=169388 RepID=A0A9P9JSB0_FUSSL|nr:uncharacterized protein B0J15DRAFT_197927 [Fusarium solani]KAH7231461.1 hypothetical protein B0J15DRAFT_197927 [Fusarium solani]
MHQRMRPVIVVYTPLWEVAQTIPRGSPLKSVVKLKNCSFTAESALNGRCVLHSDERRLSFHGPTFQAPLSLSCADVSSEKTRNMSTRRTADTETYSRDDLDFSSTKWTESEHYESCSTSSHGDLRSSPLEVLDVLGITDREREALFSYCRSDGLREAGNRVHRDERHLRPPKRVRMVSPSPEPPEGEHEQFEEWVCRSFDELFSGARRDWTLA